MPPSIQDTFLAECRTGGGSVTIQLTSGKEISGVIKGFDPFTLLVDDASTTHLVYKHAIALIVRT